MFKNRLLPRSFYINLLIRVILFGLTCFGFSWSSLRIADEYLWVSLNLGFLIIIQIWLMYRYMIRIDGELGRFLEAVNNEEYSGKIFDKKQKKGFDRFRNILNQINDIIRKKSFEIREQEIWYKEVINQSPGGIILFNKNGSVLHSNQAARNMLGMENITNIKNLKKANTNLPDLILITPPGTTFHSLVNNSPGDGTFINKKVNLSFRKSELLISKGSRYLVAFQDINKDLIIHESESWKKLIRVLRHEIMNSISPIGALSKSMLNYVQNDKKELINTEQMSDENLQRINRGLQTIEEASVSILDFVNRYKNLTSLPEPKYKKTELNKILESALSLIQDVLQNKEIILKYKLHQNNSNILADPDLIKQVIINLIKNSIEAMENKKESSVEIKTFQDKQNIILTITDNGQGMSKDVLDQIFIPFFTTKNQGSGIGLTLARQIINSHNGEIRVKSIPGEGTAFAIYLPLLN